MEKEFVCYIEHGCSVVFVGSYHIYVVFPLCSLDDI